MAFFNKFLKRRKTGEKNEAPKKDEPVRAPEKKDAGETRSIRFGVSPAIKRAHITEKSNVAGERGTYTFVVASHANKSEVKRAVEAKYSVSVRRVNMLSMPGKVRRRGRQVGWKSGFKKAVVMLQEGERIDTQ